MPLFYGWGGSRARAKGGAFPLTEHLTGQRRQKIAGLPARRVNNRLDAQFAAFFPLPTLWIFEMIFFSWVILAMIPFAPLSLAFSMPFSSFS